MLRRRLMKRTAWFLVGAVVFVPASQIFPPVELDPILIFMGILFFAALSLGYWIEHRARRRREVEALKRIYFGLIPVPWVLAAVLFVNGRFDSSIPRTEPAAIIGKVSVAGLPRGYRLVVTSWRGGRSIERVPVPRDDFDRFHPGDEVVVVVQDGLAGIPWVSAVHRP
ncbi:MAG TPA: hypothetical protein VEH50_14355 [Methylomirabilota bacterium]|nr:hypothetical protein [Methylomirabilota bacterium]